MRDAGYSGSTPAEEMGPPARIPSSFSARRRPNLVVVSLPVEDVAFIRGFDPDRDRTASRADMVRVIQHLQAALLDARIDQLHGPGAAAALNEAIADGSIFGEPTHKAAGVCESHGVTGVCPEDGVLYEGPEESDG
jgi:hypothetical protein